MRVPVNGVELEYLEEGTGIPVVFSHGGSSDARYWEPQRAAFASRYRFVAYSRRFHGAGTWAADHDAADDHARDLLALIRRLAAGPVHVVGFSTADAVRATLIDPGVVRTLTVIEPNIPSLIDGDPVLSEWRADNLRLRTEAGDDEDRRARLWFELVNGRGPGSFDTQDATFRQMWLDNFSSPRPPVHPPEPITCAQLASINVPTLALAAEHGMAYSRRILDALAGCIPGCRREVIPSVTHFMSYQAPDTFNETVLAFLADH